MALEVLVLGLCLGDYECSTATKALYASRPEYKRIVKKVKNEAVLYLGKETLVVLPIIASMAVHQTINLKIAKDLTLSANQDTIKLNYGFTF